MKRALSPAVAAMTLALGAPAAMAATQIGEHVSVSGFGTIGAMVTDNDGAQYRSDLRQFRGADKSPDFGVDSRLGLQANVKFNDTFSAVGQLLTSRRKSDRPVVEWLYGQASLPAGFSLQLGRMVLPTFMVSDSRSVGYAAHWLRAPQEVYAQYPGSSFDGGQLQYKATLGPVNLTAQLAAGKSKSDISLLGTAATVDFEKLRSANLLLETGNWLFRLGQTQAPGVKISGVPLPPLDDRFTGVGVQYDNGTLLVMGEYTMRRQSDPSPFDSNSWYLSSGWRFGAWMPYATISRLTPKGPLFGGTPDEKVTAIGVRWDAMKNVDIKAQFQKIDASTRTSFVNVSPAFAAERPTVNALSVAVDFVF
jgi:hypothetical protein